MKRYLFVLMVLGLAMCLTSPAFCDETKQSEGDDTYGYGMMEHGRGMGRGYMRDDAYHGWGMHELGRHYMRPRAWESMKPEQKKKFEKMRAAHLMDTLELRKKLATNRIELKSLWAQPEVNHARIEKLSDEIAKLSTELSKKRDKHLMQCRKELGDLDWDCPGGKW